jgi:hypothetical protein
MERAAIEARFRLAASRLRSALLELRYRQDQPRVPAGNPEGGQWTDGGATNAIDLLVAELGVDAITKHGIDQIITRGVSPSAVLDAIRNPIKIRPRSNMTTQYVGNGATVVINSYGGLVTVWPR